MSQKRLKSVLADADIVTEILIAGARLGIELAMRDGDRELAREAFEAMRARHKERTPEAVAKLEKARGLKK
jgi:hypothetical protein